MKHINLYVPKIGERVEKASQYIEQENKLLDIGCENGILAHFVKHRVKKLYGIDNNEEALEEARRFGYKVKLVDLDSQKIPFPNNYFDVVVCLDVIEHVKDPSFLLSEILRVLIPKGKLIISTPNIRFSDHIITLLFKGIFPKTSLDPELYDGGHIHFFTYTDMHFLLNDAGFKTIKDFGIINKDRRGWKGRLIEKIIGRKMMLEFRAPGILITAQK